MSARVNLEMTGDERKVLASLTKLEAKVKSLEGGVTSAAGKMKSKFDQTGDSIEKAGKKSKSAFGAEAVQGLKTYLGAAVSIGGAIALITKGLTEADAIRKEAAQGLKTGFTGGGQLAQVSGGDAQVLASDLAGARAFRTEFGFGNVNSAALQFKLKSVGLLRDSRTFGRLRGIETGQGVIEVAGGVGKVRTSFGAAAGDSRQILNKLLKAAAVSDTTVGQLGPALSISAVESAEIGGTLAEQAAIVSILSLGKKTAAVASTQVRALTQTITKKGLAGKGILAAIPQLRKQADELPPEERVGFFGSQEAFGGFLLIEKNLAQIESTRDDIVAAGRAAPGQGPLARQRRAFLAQPRLGAVHRQQIARQRRLVDAEMGEGVDAIDRETARDDVRRRTRGRGSTGFVTRAAAATAEFLGTEPETITRIGRVERGTMSSPLIDEIGRRLLPLVQVVELLQTLVTIAGEQGKGPTLIPAQVEAPPPTSRLQD